MIKFIIEDFNFIFKSNNKEYHLITNEIINGKTFFFSTDEERVTIITVITPSITFNQISMQEVCDFMILFRYENEKIINNNFERVEREIYSINVKDYNYSVKIQIDTSKMLEGNVEFV